MWAKTWACGQKRGQNVPMSFVVIFRSTRKLDDNAKRLGLIWLGIGILILVVITKGLRQKPPQMSDPVSM